MSNDFKTPDFSNFGIMANSPFPTPDAFLVKEIADQNTFTNPFNNEYNCNPHNNTYYDRNDSLWEDEDYTNSLWDDEDDDYDDYEEEE